MNNDTTFLAFRNICNFVNDLASVYASKYKPLRLYHRLINQTQIGHVEAIEKHVSQFRDFCVQNRDAIYENDASKIKMNTVSYSGKVYINFTHIFDISDPDTKPVIWRHLLTISAILDPAGNAKNILKNLKSENGEKENKENDFLFDLINKVEKNIDPTASPTEAMASVMKSGFMTEIFGSMETSLKNGQLDMGKMLGAVQKVVSSLESSIDESDTDSKQAVGMINNVINSMGNMGNSGSNEQPNMGNIMNLMTSFMGNMNKK